MKALIIVDIQNDFLPGGPLAVKEGDTIIPLINDLQRRFELIVATQDWHPKDHGSFASNHNKQPGERVRLAGLDQILWPDHCIQGTKGADFAAALRTDRIAKIIRKGTDKAVDSYSTFFDNGHVRATGLGDYLKEQGVSEVYLAGLATDYCVKYSALDAQGLGFKTYVIPAACRGVELHPGDVQAAIKEMENKGVHILKEVRNA